MATISRTWQFNDSVSTELSLQTFSAQFVANGISFDWMRIEQNGAYPNIWFGQNGTDVESTVGTAVYIGAAGWVAGYQTVNFGAPQYIDDSLYIFIIQNAIKQEETEFEIDILNNGTKTLKTKGKYCDRDIHVNVRVSSTTAPYIIPAGTYKAGNTGASTPQDVQLLEFQQDINFTSGGVNYTGMWMTYYPESQGTAENPDSEEITPAVWVLTYAIGGAGANVYNYWPSKGYGLWKSEAELTITIPERQEVSAAYLDWFARSFAGIAPETAPEYDGTVTVA